MDPAVAEKSDCFIRIICVISGLPEIIRHFNISWPATEIHLKSSTDRHFLIWDFLRGKESEDSPGDASLKQNQGALKQQGKYENHISILIHTSVTGSKYKEIS